MDQDIQKFATKCAIAAFFFFSAVTITTHFVFMIATYRVMDITEMAVLQISTAIRIQTSNAGSRLIDATDRVLAEQADPANNHLSPEKRQRMQKNMRTVWEKWRFLWDEIGKP